MLARRVPRSCSIFRFQDLVSFLVPLSDFPLFPWGRNVPDSSLARVGNVPKALFPEVWGEVLQRIIGSSRYRGTMLVSFEEFKTMASSLPGILLAQVGAKKKWVRVGQYSCMDAMRAILAVLESFGVAPVVYDQHLHKWFQRRQSRKYKSGRTWTWQAADVDRMVSRLRSFFKEQ